MIGKLPFKAKTEERLIPLIITKIYCSARKDSDLHPVIT